jgi:hydroxypyruvate isomerase
VGALGAALAAGAGLAGPAAAGAAPAGPPAGAPRTFRLRYAPHFGMFRAHAGEDLVAQLEFARAEGFTAWEDNGMRDRSVADQERVARAKARLGMQMGVIVGHSIDWNAPTLATGDAAVRDRFLGEIRASAEVAKRVNGRWLVVVPGVADRRHDAEYQMVHVIETLRRAVDVLAPQGLGVLLEPLNVRRDHPGQLLSRVPQLHLVVRAVNSPACKLLYDCYHEQINEGNLLPTIDAVYPDIGYVQTGDTPGRNEPGTGEVNYRNVFRHLYNKGYRGIVGMEHGASRPGREGERAVIDAYVAADAWV